MRGPAALVALVVGLTSCGGAAPSSTDYRAAAIRTAFAQAGMTSYMTESSGTRSSNGFNEGSARIVFHLAPGCPMPNDYFSTFLRRSLYTFNVAASSALVFTHCRSDWVVTYLFKSAHAASNTARVRRESLTAAHLLFDLRGNVLMVYRAAAKREARSALGNFH
jgi:hypothetical protein